MTGTPTTSDGVLQTGSGVIATTSDTEVTSLGSSEPIEINKNLDYGTVAFNSDNIFVGSTVASGVLVYDKNFERVDTFSGLQPATMAATENYLFLSDSAGQVFRKLDADDGTAEWRFSYDDENQFNWMAIDGNDFTYIGDFGTGEEAWKVDPSDGSQPWVDSLDAGFRSAGVDGDGNYVYFTDANGDFYRFASNGDREWGPLRKDFNFGGTGVVTSGASEGMAVKHSGDTVVAVNPDGSDAWRFTDPSGSAGDLAVLDDQKQIVAGDHDTNLYVLDFHGNWELGTSTLYGYHSVAVDIPEEYVYAVDDAGNFHAVDITVS
jgi:hypothetical protein